MTTPGRPAPSAGWARAWVWACLALGAHVADEVATGFLSLWNPWVLALRERMPFVPLPAFRFDVWLGGLIAALVLLLFLTPAARRPARWMRPVSYGLAVMLVGNGLLHIGASLYLWRVAPGAITSPLLLLAGARLLLRVRRASAAAEGPDGVATG